MADLRSELLAIRAEYGALTPEAVVIAATPEDHPLHSRFEWDDSEAAHRYRLDQARSLIRVVRETYRDDTGVRKSLRYFHAVPRGTGMVYSPVDEVLQDPVTTRILMAQMKRDWLSLKARYDHFAEFRELVQRDLEGSVQPPASRE